MRVFPTNHKHKRAFLADGAGFLGLHLRERPMSQGHEVFARTKLGWRPKTKQHDGLRPTIDDFDDTLTDSGRKLAASVSHIFSHRAPLNVVGSVR
jgi:hypothetical protein